MLDENTGSQGAEILLGTLRKRWLMLLIAVAVSGGLATAVCLQLGKHTAVVKSILIYTGLPNSTSHQTARDSLGPATGAEMITSPLVLNKLREKSGLEFGTAQLARMIKATTGRSSSLLNLSLDWSDAAEGITVLNALSEVFIEEMASQRKSILRDHLQHVEISLLQAKIQVDEAQQQLHSLREQQQRELDKGGATSDQYQSLQSNIANTDIAFDETTANQLGTEQQFKALGKHIDVIIKEQKKVEQAMRRDLLREAARVVKEAERRLPPGSADWKRIETTKAELVKLSEAGPTTDGYSLWRESLSQLVTADSNGLTKLDRAELEVSLLKLEEKNVTALATLHEDHRQIIDRQNQLGQSLIPIQIRLEMLKRRREGYQKQADSLRAELTTVKEGQLDEAERQLEQAEGRQSQLAVQRDEMRQFEQTRIREWAITVPASMETTTLDSNHMKLFVLTFGAACLALTSPLFLLEWRAQRNSPQVEFARSVRIPVLAERILQDFLPKQRANADRQLSAEYLEGMRMLTLRIQQSCHRSGSVVLFSSLDPAVSVAPLMAGVAQCLAEREERVLLVDAVSPDSSSAQVLDLMLPDATKESTAEDLSSMPGALALTSRVDEGEVPPGLSEFLSRECEAVGDLVRPTGYPGIDIISSGRMRFPREAMASSCITELIEACRRNYTVILVHAPPANCAADLQMLAARADGIVLAATKETASSPQTRLAVEDLLEVGAPIIGLVA